ncbi:D-alanyl-D-alanine carboxypeptidase family protein [Allobacillus sp. GCM10007491]|nr:D-alanyl-D-alanine carboxypeptidase family protein [Allobacillus saliphilus]
MIRKHFILLLTVLLMMPSISIFAEDAELTNHSSSSFLMEVDTGTVLHEKNAHKQLPPASMTKLMTLLLIMEEIDQGKLTLSEKVRVSEYAASMGGSQIFLEPNEEMSVDDLLKSIAIASANDSSVALAERIAVSEENFVKRMNERVKELGLKNTKFKNVTGLPEEGHFSSAYDMAKIAQELLKHDEITSYTQIYEDYLRKGTDEEFWLVNTNKLVKFYQGVDGLKTGYTNAAKYCLTATAKRGDMRVIAVSMGAETVKDRNADVTNMLDYAFSHYELHKLHDKEIPLYSWSHLKSEQDELNLVADQNVSVLLSKGEKMKDYKTVVEPGNISKWPMKQGEQLGYLHVKKGDTTMKKIPLYVQEDVQEAGLLKLFNRVGKYLHQGYKTSNKN